MTTTTPERLVQLNMEMLKTRERLDAVIVHFESFKGRRLPATTKENTKTALTQLFLSRQHLNNALVAFIGEME